VASFSEPVQTYVVVDLLENLDKSRIRIEEHMDGFDFSVEMAKLTPSSRQMVIETLRSALQEVAGTPFSPTYDLP
jgi:hypothetical protein